jgi:hypothetical protein
MNVALLEILEKFLVIVWPMLRLSAFLAFTSIFSIRAVNLRIRMCLGFALAFFVSQQIDIPRIDPLTAEGLLEIFRQILIGLTMGLVFQVASATLVVAGQAIAGSMGLSMANMIDPNMGSVPVLSWHRRPFDCVWPGAGVVQAVTHWPGVFLARHAGQDDQLERHDVLRRFIDWLTGANDFAVHQHRPWICGPCCAKFEYFYRRLSRLDLGGICHFDFLHGQQRLAHPMGVDTGVFGAAIIFRKLIR